MSAPNEELIALGIVTRAQGVRGQLRVKLYNPDSELLVDRRVAYFVRDGNAQLGNLRAKAREHQGDVLLWPIDCDDRDKAEAMRGTEIALPSSALPALPDGEYYHRDLIGMSVRDMSGAVIGNVARIDSYPTVDVALVHAAEGGGTIEIPILDPYWVSVDLTLRCVVVDHIDHLRALHSEAD